MGEAGSTINTYHMHELEEVDEQDPFVCNQCKVEGWGCRYTCKPCNYSLHPFCATCPAILPSSPAHRNELKLLNAVIMPYSPSCDICCHKIHGTFYFCTEHRDFSAHALCVKGVVDQPRESVPRHQPYSDSANFTPENLVRTDAHIDGVGLGHAGNMNNVGNDHGGQQSKRSRLGRQALQLVKAIAVGVLVNAVGDSLMGFVG